MRPYVIIISLHHGGEVLGAQLAVEASHDLRPLPEYPITGVKTDIIAPFSKISD
jgi:hypothetical protein